MNELSIIAGLLLLATIVAASLYALERIQRRKAFLRWAASQDFRIMDYRQPVLTEKSPFPIVASKAQQIFHFTAQLPDGTRKSGWVLLGSAWSGLYSKQARIQWDS